MKRLLILSVAAFLTAATICDNAWAQITGGVNPPGNERRSMGNLRPNQFPANPGASVGRGPDGFSHRRYSYGNQPYYRRPPTTPYYVTPPYSGYDRGYGYYVYPWNGRPYFVPPRGYWYPAYPYYW